MFRNTSIISKIFSYAFVVLLLVATAPGWAAPISAVQLLTELMIENQGNNAGFLGLMFGPDSSSPLVFESNVDPSTNTFSYNLTPGATYLGQSLALTGSGAFDSLNNSVSFSSSGTLSSEPWMISGGGDISLITSVYVLGVHLDLWFGLAMQKTFDLHAEISFFEDGTSRMEGYYTDMNGNKIPESDFTSRNRYKIADAGEWEYESDISGLGFAVRTEGYSPLEGGVGTFTTSVVPEPSILFLIGSGLLLLTGLAGQRSLSRCRKGHMDAS